MSRPKAISKCTALVARQVNRHKYRFSRRLPLPCIVMNGPPKSTAVLVNAFSDVCSLAKGSGAMICCAALAFRRRHSAHSRSHSLIASRAEMIQYRADNVAKVWLVPNAWFPFSWASLIISFVSQHFRGKITGYRTSCVCLMSCISACCSSSTVNSLDILPVPFLWQFPTNRLIQAWIRFNFNPLEYLCGANRDATPSSTATKVPTW